MAEEHDTPEGEEQDNGATPDELGDAGKRALEAERKARRVAEKRAQEAEAKVKEAEDAEKTEVERLTGQVADLEKKLGAATAKSDRFEVAAAKGLTLAQARRLVGDTKEELESDADDLLADLGLKNEKDDEGENKPEAEEETPVFARATEDLKGGASPAGEETVDAAKLATTILSN